MVAVVVVFVRTLLAEKNMRPRIVDFVHHVRPVHGLVVLGDVRGVVRGVVVSEPWEYRIKSVWRQHTGVTGDVNVIATTKEGVERRKQTCGSCSRG